MLGELVAVHLHQRVLEQLKALPVWSAEVERRAAHVDRGDARVVQLASEVLSALTPAVTIDVRQPRVETSL